MMCKCGQSIAWPLPNFGVISSYLKIYCWMEMTLTSVFYHTLLDMIERLNKIYIQLLSQHHDSVLDKIWVKTDYLCTKTVETHSQNQSFLNHIDIMSLLIKSVQFGVHYRPQSDNFLREDSLGDIMSNSLIMFSIKVR